VRGLEGVTADFGAAMERVWRELADQGDDRDARFVCALALAMPGAPTRVFEGEARGTIVWPPRGDKGFGYDPIFLVPKLQRTVAELSMIEKGQVSHRGKALLAVRSYLLNIQRPHSPL